MKRALIFGLLIIMTNKLTGQEKLNFNCSNLQKAIELDFFRERFFLDKFDSDTLIIVDTNYYFNDCAFPVIHGKYVTFERKHSYSTELKSPLESKNKIVIYKAKSEGNKSKISFWRPYNNGAMTVEVKQRKCKTSVNVLEYGSF